MYTYSHIYTHVCIYTHLYIYTHTAREQAGAALANACANCMENQTAARHSGTFLVYTSYTCKCV